MFVCKLIFFFQICSFQCPCGKYIHLVLHKWKPINKPAALHVFILSVLCSRCLCFLFFASCLDNKVHIREQARNHHSWSSHSVEQRVRRCYDNNLKKHVNHTCVMFRMKSSYDLLFHHLSLKALNLIDIWHMFTATETVSWHVEKKPELECWMKNTAGLTSLHRTDLGTFRLKQSFCFSSVCCRQRFSDCCLYLCSEQHSQISGQLKGNDIAHIYCWIYQIKVIQMYNVLNWHALYLTGSQLGKTFICVDHSPAHYLRCGVIWGNWTCNPSKLYITTFEMFHTEERRFHVIFIIHKSPAITLNMTQYIYNL